MVNMKQQSLIDLIGWGLFVLIIYFVISALYGCGSVKPTQPVYDDWGAIKPWQYGPIVEPEVYTIGDNIIEWRGYTIVDVGDTLIVLKNQ